MHLQAQLGCLLHIRIMATAPPPPPSKSQSNDDCYPEGFGNVLFLNKIRWLVVVMVVTNNKYSITACPGDQVLPIAQSGSRQTRPRITGIYSKSILPTPKYRHRQGYPLILVSLFLPPLFCRHYHCGPFFSFVPSAKGKWCSLTKNHILCRLTS